jgi:hypothetical protein
MIGLTEGDAGGHATGGQIGGRSIELLHRGWFTPLMQVQMQSAYAESDRVVTALKTKTTISKFRMGLPTFQ